MAVYRWACVVAALGIAIPHLLGFGAELPTYLAVLRLVAAASFLLVLAISFASQWMRRHIAIAAFICALLALAFYGTAVPLLNLNLRAVLTSIVVLVSGSMAFQRPLLVIAWLVACCTVFVSAALSLEAPELEPAMYALMILVIAGFTGFAAVFTIRSREKVSETSAIMSAIFDRSADALAYGSTSNVRVMEVNRKLVELFKTSDQDRCFDLIKMAFAGAGTTNIAHRLEKENPIVETMAITDDEDNLFWGNIHIGTIDVAHRDLLLMRITDITELHERSIALEAARNAAEHATNVRTRFLANMSHEIRTPMNGVIGVTSLLQNSGLNDEQTSLVEIIRSSGESLLAIINEILDFSKIEAGQIQLESHEFDLEQCLAEALDVVTPLASQKSLELVLDIDPRHAVTVVGDRLRLRQVLINLLSNAVKFTDRGEVILRVTGTEPSPASGSVNFCFEVIDTGIGIQAGDLDALFQPFTQADSGASRRFGGTGLGLTISNTFVELMGGEIFVESEPGRGSTFGFNVKLPVGNRDADRWSHAASLRGRTAAILTANETLRKALTRMLEAWELEIGGDTTLEGCMTASEQAEVDVVLVDADIAHGNGEWLSQNLVARFPHAPEVLLLVPLGQQEGLAGIDAISLCKPAGPGVLLRALLRSFGENPKVRADVQADNDNAPIIKAQKVLLCEDNPVNQTVARKMLGRLGVAVDLAKNGREALEMVSHQQYGIVFMDVQMPEVDGLEATRLIREMRGLKQPYIIAMTANAMAEDRELCFESGMDDFVPKPVRLQEVQEALRRAVSEGV